MNMMSTMVGCSGGSKRPFSERAYYLNRSLLAERLSTFVLRGKEDEMREELLDESIKFFESARVGFRVTLRLPLSESNKFPLTEAMRDLGIILKYFRTNNIRIGPTNESELDNYLSTLKAFKNFEPYEPQNLEKLMQFYKWDSTYSFRMAR